MPYPSLYQINTRVWLRDLAGTLGRPATLADLPDAFLDDAASLGFDYLWFLGLWQTGAASRQVVLDHPQWQQEFQAALSDFSPADLISSPFAVTAYALHPDFGGPSGPGRSKGAPARPGPASSWPISSPTTPPWTTPG